VSFLHPLALLGLAAAALPALLHLLHRRTPPELEFPPVRYLSDAERRSARRLRLRHLLLLLLRTALIVALVLAAARPLVSTRGGGRVHAPTALVVVLDNSLSAGAVVDGRPVLDRLKVATRAVLGRLAVADRCWLMLADGVARAGTAEALLSAVDSAGIDPRRLDLVAAVTRAAALVDAEPLPAREVHVVSDLQRTALTGTVQPPRGVRIIALAATGAAPPNRGIAVVRPTERALAVTIGGTPGTPAGPVTLRLRTRQVGRALAAPQATVTLPLPPSPPGWWVGEAELAPDELRADDRRPFVWRVAPAARVSAGPTVGAFLSAALAVLTEGGRVTVGSAPPSAAGAPEVTFGERPGPGGGGAGTASASVVIPPADAALLGQANRALAAHGVAWRFAAPGTPGPLASATLGTLAGVQVTRRYRLEGVGPGGGKVVERDSAVVLATVNGEPWLVRAGTVVLVGSRLDTGWTALPATPAFVPFVDALANRLTRGEAEIAEAEGEPRVLFTLRGADTVGATVYGPDPRESDLTPASRALAHRVLGGADVLNDAEFAAAAFAGTRRADASGVLLVLALLLAGAELGVATLTP
jgi:hypothetical protein